MEKKSGYYSFIASLATSIVIMLLFYILGMQRVTAIPWDYKPVDVYAGMLYVFILSMIVSASIYTKVPNMNRKIVSYISLSIIVIALFYFSYVALVAPSSLNAQNPSNDAYEVNGSIVSVNYDYNYITVQQEEIPGVMPVRIVVYSLENLNGIRISDFVEGDNVRLVLRRDVNNPNFALIRVTKSKSSSVNKSGMT
ncbi:MAG: hypothetical protein OIN85_06820 [Candidatus Methanoperedens sp.]|nr:hypothetical protein [Candidatus Methanoperedens sp.]